MDDVSVRPDAAAGPPPGPAAARPAAAAAIDGMAAYAGVLQTKETNAMHPDPADMTVRYKSAEFINVLDDADWDVGAGVSPATFLANLANSAQGAEWAVPAAATVTVSRTNSAGEEQTLRVNNLKALEKHVLKNKVALRSAVTFTITDPAE